MALHASSNTKSLQLLTREMKVTMRANVMRKLNSNFPKPTGERDINLHLLMGKARPPAGICPRYT